jgi:hypothetical protein
VNKSTINLFYYTLSAVILALSFSLALSESFRSYLSVELLSLDKRKVLSVLEYNSKAGRFKIVKVQKGQALSIEVYDEKNVSQADFGLGKNLNGAIFLNGKTTELAAYDLNKDGQKEVIIPTLSKNRKSLIFILKFDPSLNIFTLDSPISYIDQLGP